MAFDWSYFLPVLLEVDYSVYLFGNCEKFWNANIYILVHKAGFMMKVLILKVIFNSNSHSLD